MTLWNDYEGKTIAEVYPLKKLVRPEGRSAFFETANGTGTLSMIRLTEALNDEYEMLERWRQVKEVHQENLVAIKTFGQTTFDGVPLAYALMELTDANLADILKERPLTASETTEVAKGVVAALVALHASGLVHEHIDATNVLATGEVIKLRSDCVRECVADPEFSPMTCDELKQRDVHDLGALLLRCLTLERQVTPSMRRLPAPFDSIVKKGMDGSWGLAEIAGALNPAVVRPEGLPARSLVPQSVLAEAMPRAVVVEAGSEFVERHEPAAAVAPAGPALHVRRIQNTVEPAPRSAFFWMACAAGLIAILLIAWMLLRGKPASAPAVVAHVPTIADTPVGRPPKPSAVVTQEAPAPRAGKAPIAQQPVSSPVKTDAKVGDGTGNWRVIACTYNHEAQAQAKVVSIRKQHPALNPEVFSPSSGVFLVSVGGVMTRSEAETIRNRARRAGLARDTFIRNYKTRS